MLTVRPQDSLAGYKSADLESSFTYSWQTRPFKYFYPIKIIWNLILEQLFRDLYSF